MYDDDWARGANLYSRCFDKPTHLSDALQLPNTLVLEVLKPASAISFNYPSKMLI
jgi:hypothetical protein